VANRALLERLLEREGYRTKAVGDGEAALLAVAEHGPDLVLLDIGLPHLDGYEVTRRLRANIRTVAVPIILLTGRSTLADVVEGLDAGADDFLSKPFRQPEMLARIRSALRLRQALVRMDAAHAAVAALDAAEWDLMRRHPEIGERICEPLAAAGTFTPIVRHHHERWDGRGYPDGLRGESIPLGARIVGLVDAFDAMTHDRPYRRAMPTALAVNELRREAGGQFDRALVPTFVIELERDAAVILSELPPSALLATG
jgi:response regulator RpfG family c-di-GMP phosphodiesterase